jgi:hypothetical protein
VEIRNLLLRIAAGTRRSRKRRHGSKLAAITRCIAAEGGESTLRSFQVWPSGKPENNYKFLAEDVADARRKAKQWAWDGFYEDEIQTELAIHEVGRSKCYSQKVTVGPVPDKSDPDWRKKPCCGGCRYGAIHRHSRIAGFIKWIGAVVLALGGVIVSVMAFSILAVVLLGALLGGTKKMVKSYERLE